MANAKAGKSMDTLKKVYRRQWRQGNLRLLVVSLRFDYLQAIISFRRTTLNIPTCCDCYFQTKVIEANSNTSGASTADMHWVQMLFQGLERLP